MDSRTRTPPSARRPRWSAASRSSPRSSAWSSSRRDPARLSVRCGTHPRSLAGNAALIDPVALIRFASTLLVPPRCAVCGAASDPAAAMCRRCLGAVCTQRVGLRRIGGVDVLWAAPYAGVARELVAALKFRGRLELARVAGAAVAAATRERVALDGRVVVPVPAARLRLHRRGFDPGEMIAAAAAEHLGLPVAHCLARSSGRRQVGRDRATRLGDPPRVRAVAAAPAAALLVDDVLTTGATVGACARALRSAGCRDLAAAVFAHALGPASAGA